MTERSEDRPTVTEPVSGPRRWLERIKINRFRSIEPGTELRFSEGLHVVLGKNASGKSTLLDLIAAALALDFDRSPFDDELDVEFTLRIGDLRFEAIVKRTLQDTQVSNRQEDVPDLRSSFRQADRYHEEGRYVLRAPSGLKVTVVLTSADIPVRVVEGVDTARYRLDKPLEQRDRKPPLAPRLRGLYNLALQGSFRGGAAVSTLLGTVVSIAVDNPFRMPEGNELLHELEDDARFAIFVGKTMRTRPSLLPHGIYEALKLDGAAIEVPLDVEPLPFAFVREMGFSKARMSLGPPRVERHYGQEGFVYSSPTFTFHRDGRLVRRIDQLSYGQRRLFALGWYLACTCDVAILDEPSNGLHESWIEFLVSQLHDRQVFLTSQNREFLDMLPFTTETQLSRGFILCESRPQPGGDEPTLHWRGLRDDESALMIKALRASRVDLITDLLRALDLW